MTGILEFALPYDEGIPPQSPSLRLNGEVTATVALKLGNPEVPPRLRQGGPRATGMPMPETAMHPNHLTSPRKGDVRAARKGLVLKTIPVSHVGEQAT